MNIITFVHKLSTGLKTCLLLYTPQPREGKAQYLKIPTLHFSQEKGTTNINVYVDRRVAVTADIAT